jgi:peptidoglycan/LPS O-acetylase OafA/YrhL
MSVAADHQRLPGLDTLRLLAMLLVTVQHGMSALGLYEQTSPGGVNLGQVGVAIFCAISGYLAFHTRDDAPGRWFLARLQQIFPAYWVAMLFSFLLTWAFQVKDFDTWQFASQMLGLGYFTHGWELVNVVSWFISLILLCYLIATLAKWLRSPSALLALASLVTWVLVFQEWEVDFSRHILAFSLAGLLRLNGGRVWLLAPLLIVCPPWPQFSYGAIALVLLSLLTPWRGALPALVKCVANHVYEFFLLHGIFLVGGIRLLPAHPLMGIALGIAASTVAAIGLKRLIVRGMPLWLDKPVSLIK